MIGLFRLRAVLKVHLHAFLQRTLAYFLRGSITVQLTSCLTGLDSTKQVDILLIQHKRSSWIQTKQTGGQQYSDTSSYKVSECSLTAPSNILP